MQVDGERELIKDSSCQMRMRGIEGMSRDEG